MKPETLEDARRRLRRAGLQVPAVALASVLTFGGIAAALPDYASAQPSSSASQDPDKKAVKEFQAWYKQMSARHGVAFENTLRKAGLKHLVEFGKTGAASWDSDFFGPGTVAEYLTQNLPDLKKSVDKALTKVKKGRYIDQEAKEARERAELLRRDRDAAKDPDSRAKATAEFDEARKQAHQAEQAAKTYNRKMAEAKKLREQAAGARTDADRKRLKEAARIAEQKAKEVIADYKATQKAIQKGQTGKTGTTGKTGDTGTGKTGSTGTGTGSSSGGSSRSGRFLKGFGLFGMLLGGDDPMRAVRLEVATREARMRTSFEALKKYAMAHPKEAHELVDLARSGKLPALDPDKMRTFLANWDKEHDDKTGRKNRTTCGIYAELGGVDSCPPPKPQTKAEKKRAEEKRQAKNRDAQIADRKVTAEQETAAAKKKAAEKAEEKRLAGNRDAQIADRKESAKRETKAEQERQAKNRDAQIADKKTSSVKKPVTKAQKTTEAKKKQDAKNRDAVIADKKTSSVKKPTTKAQTPGKKAALAKQEMAA